MKYTPVLSSSPLPLGTSCKKNDTHITWNFAIYSTEKLTHLIIQDFQRVYPPHLIDLDETQHKTGDIWHIRITTTEEFFLWAWAKRDPSDNHNLITIQDPFAKLLDTNNVWGNNNWKKLTSHNEILPLGVALDWDLLYALSHPYKNLEPTPNKQPRAIYEMHLRGFTQDISSNTHFRGTFKAAIQKLPHLVKMGIDIIELLPITEFDETEWPFVNPITNERLYNYWGYSPLNFFSPMGRYFSSSNSLDWPYELNQFVRACHEKNIRVILDLVYNHTGEGNEKGPSYSFKSLAPDTYYIRDNECNYLNYSGCGNTINANHPVVIDMIRESLRHWVLAYGIDGFRFDLAACLTRSQTGAPMAEPPLIQEIAQDPILRNKLLIVEPWDAAGLHQTGLLHQLNQTKTTLFHEWNDKYRDDVRRFMKGDKGFAGVFASRVSGSQDIYRSAPSPKVSINYITAHDGFSLKDLVSYNTKHNLTNSEENRDGMNENYSWNCGYEGKTNDTTCASLRKRRMVNMLTALFLSQGIPMILMGDEYGHTKHGNNNAWCHDSKLNWFDWKKVSAQTNFTKYIRTLIQIRSIPHLFDKEQFLTINDVQWHGKNVGMPDWSLESQYIAFTLNDKTGKAVLYAAFSAHMEDIVIEIPSPPIGHYWHTVIDSGTQSCYELHKAPKMEFQHVKLSGHSCLILIVDYLRNHHLSTHTSKN